MTYGRDLAKTIKNRHFKPKYSIFH